MARAQFGSPPNVAAIKRQIIEVVLIPFFKFMWAMMGHVVDMGNVACVEASRRLRSVLGHQEVRGRVQVLHAHLHQQRQVQS